MSENQQTTMRAPRNTANMTPARSDSPATANAGPAKQSIAAIMGSLLDSEGYRRRFDDLLGKRAPQFVSSIVSMVNGDAKLQKAFMDAPITVIQSALKAATYDLPIDPGLGYAYIVPFNNSLKDENGKSIKGPDGKWLTRMEASFIMGYKGMTQLALRTGAYKTVPHAIDVREGELIKYDRLRRKAEINWIDDEDERDKRPIIGWVGYYELINGTEMTLYMSRKQIDAHERKHRKGDYMGKGWRDDYNGMAMKTVVRQLIGKYGLMSIDYQSANPATLAAAEAIAAGTFDDEDAHGEIAGEMAEDFIGEPIDDDDVK